MSNNPIPSKTLTYFLVWFLLALQPSAIVYAQGPSITPNRLEVSLAAGECVTQEVTVNTGIAPPPKLDVVFVIDVTSSMIAVINETTAKIGPIVDNIRLLTPDTVFALATVADYPEPGRDQGIEAWTLEQSFSADVNLIQGALADLTLFGSGDNDEAYLRALYETQFLEWRPDSRRVVILFGDAPAHNPDPGPDGQLGSADDLTQGAVFEQLVAANITVLTTSSDAADFLRAVAQETSGQFFALFEPGQISEAVQTLLEQTLNRINSLSFEVIASGPAWLTWEPPAYESVEIGEARPFTLTLCVPENTPAGDYTLDLTAVGDGVPLDQILASVNVLPRADLILGQTAGPDTILAGERLSYELSVTNQGLDTASGVVLTTTLPSELTIVSIDPGQGDCTQAEGTVICALESLNQGEERTVRIAASTTRDGLLNSSAEVSAAEVDPNPTDNTISTTVAVGAAADLALSRTGPSDPILAGRRLIYNLIVDNAGPSVATGVVLTNLLPEQVDLVSVQTGQGECQQTEQLVTCQLGELPPGERTTVDLILVSAAGGEVENVAGVTADQPDPDESNSSFSQTSTITPVADLAFTLTGPADPVSSGDSVVYTVNLSNSGPSDATGIRLTGQLPAAATFVSATISQGSCSQAANTITCTIDRLANGDQAVLNLALIPTLPGDLEIVVELSGNEFDPTPGETGRSGKTAVTPAETTPRFLIPPWGMALLLLPFVGLIIISIYDRIVDPIRRED